MPNPGKGFGIFASGAAIYSTLRARFPEKVPGYGVLAAAAAVIVTAVVVAAAAAAIAAPDEEDDDQYNDPPPTVSICKNAGITRHNVTS